MKRSAYRKLTAEQLDGRRVCLVTPVSNGAGTWPVGTTARIVGKYDGLSLRSDPCACCGVRLRIARVPPRSVMLLDGGSPASVPANRRRGECDGCHRTELLLVYRDESSGDVDQELCRRCADWPADSAELPEVA